MKDYWIRYATRAIVTLAALYSLYIVWKLPSGEVSDGLALWGLGLFVGWTAYRSPVPQAKWADAAFPWLTAAAAAGILFLLPGEIWTAVGVTLMLAALCGFIGRACLALRLLPALVVFIVLIPQLTQLAFWISIPLSQISSIMTVAVLHLFGFDVAADGAMITIGKDQIAVTAACSGVQQLEALACIGWVFVRQFQRDPWIRLIHVMTLVPVLLLANTIRLIVTILLFRAFGEWALSDSVHTTLGIGMVLISALMLWGIGAMLIAGTPNETKQNPQSA